MDIILQKGFLHTEEVRNRNITLGYETWRTLRLKSRRLKNRLSQLKYVKIYNQATHSILDLLKWQMARDG